MRDILVIVGIICAFSAAMPVEEGKFLGEGMSVQYAGPLSGPFEMHGMMGDAITGAAKTPQQPTLLSALMKGDAHANVEPSPFDSSDQPELASPSKRPQKLPMPGVGLPHATNEFASPFERFQHPMIKRVRSHQPFIDALKSEQKTSATMKPNIKHIHPIHRAGSISGPMMLQPAKLPPIQAPEQTVQTAGVVLHDGQHHLSAKALLTKLEDAELSLQKQEITPSSAKHTHRAAIQSLKKDSSEEYQKLLDRLTPSASGSSSL